MTTNEMRRVVILGVTGSGKSTLATRLARIIDAEHAELDAFNHGPNWTPRPEEEFTAAVDGVLAKPRWVVDGNYIDRVGDTLWPQADIVVWLDLPLWIVLPRIVRRTARRVRQRTELWGGNRERWSALLGKEGLLGWAVISHKRHRAELPDRLAKLARSGVRIVRLPSPGAVDRWLAAVTR